MPYSQEEKTKQTRKNSSLGNSSESSCSACLRGSLERDFRELRLTGYRFQQWWAPWVTSSLSMKRYQVPVENSTPSRFGFVLGQSTTEIKIISLWKLSLNASFLFDVRITSCKLMGSAFTTLYYQMRFSTIFFYLALESKNYFFYYHGFSVIAV